MALASQAPSALVIGSRRLRIAPVLHESRNLPAAEGSRPTKKRWKASRSRWPFTLRRMCTPKIPRGGLQRLAAPAHIHRSPTTPPPLHPPPTTPPPTTPPRKDQTGIFGEGPGGWAWPARWGGRCRQPAMPDGMPTRTEKLFPTQQGYRVAGHSVPHGFHRQHRQIVSVQRPSHSFDLRHIEREQNARPSKQLPVRPRNHSVLTGHRHCQGRSWSSDRRQGVCDGCPRSALCVQCL